MSRTDAGQRKRRLLLKNVLTAARPNTDSCVCHLLLVALDCENNMHQRASTIFSLILPKVRLRVTLRLLVPEKSILVYISNHRGYFLFQRRIISRPAFGHAYLAFSRPACLFLPSFVFLCRHLWRNKKAQQTRLLNFLCSPLDSTIIFPESR